MFRRQLILCIQQMPGRVSVSFLEDAVVPPHRLGKLLSDDNYSAGPPTSRVSPTSQLLRKQNHTVPPPSGAFRPICTRFWHAWYWQPQRPIFRFLCCCLKAKQERYDGTMSHGHVHTVENQDRSKHGHVGLPPQYKAL